jgi:lipoyl(octanoyl) transferase
VPTVRRLSGGGAILHHHEVTYALVVPASHPRARPNAQLYRAVHAAIADLLLHLGVPAVSRAEVVALEDYEPKCPLLCFTNTNAEDIVTSGLKIVGSAQRRRGGAVLQHGSILLARSCLTPELPGLCDVADVSREPSEWSDWLLQRIPDALGLRPLAVDVPDELRARASELERARYRDPRWTGLR